DERNGSHSCAGGSAVDTLECKTAAPGTPNLPDLRRRAPSPGRPPGPAGRPTTRLRARRTVRLRARRGFRDLHQATTALTPRTRVARPCARSAAASGG